MPTLGHAFPSFNQEKDMLKLLFSAAEDVAVQGDVTKRTNVKLSDGKTYLITFTQGEDGIGGERGFFGATLIPVIMKDSDAAKIADIKAFTRLLKFQERLTDHAKKDVSELAEIGVLYNSPLITGKTPEELKALLSDYVNDIKNAKSRSESLKLAIRQLVDLLELHEKSNSEPGFKFVNKVGTHEGNVQKYVLKLRQFEPINFEVKRVKVPASGGGNGANANSDTATASVNTARQKYGFNVDNFISIVTNNPANLAANQELIRSAVTDFEAALTAVQAAEAANEPNAAAARSAVDQLKTELNTIIEFLNARDSSTNDDIPLIA